MTLSIEIIVFVLEFFNCDSIIYIATVLLSCRYTYSQCLECIDVTLYQCHSRFTSQCYINCFHKFANISLMIQHFKLKY